MIDQQKREDQLEAIMDKVQKCVIDKAQVDCLAGLSDLPLEMLKLSSSSSDFSAYLNASKTFSHFLLHSEDDESDDNSGPEVMSLVLHDFDDDNNEEEICDETYRIPRSEILTTQDLRQQLFGTLDPYVDDYSPLNPLIYEEKEVEPRESVRSYRTEKNPLTYQRSILEEDSVLQEDFENEDAESTTCDGRSYLPEHEEDEILQRYAPKKAKTPRSLENCSVLTVEEKMDHFLNNKARIHQREQENEESNDELPWYIPNNPFIRDQCEGLLFWALMPEGFILQLIAGLSIFLMTTIGLFVEFNMGYLIPPILCIMDMYSSTKNKTLTWIKHYRIARQRKRNGSLKVIKNLSGLFGCTLKSRDSLIQELAEDEKVNPLHSVRLIKPDGPMQRSKRIAKKLEVNRVKICEARVVKVIDRRPHIYVSFADGKQRFALFDTGATSCCIHPKVLDAIRKKSPNHIYTETRHMGIEGVVKNSSTRTDQIAYLSFKLETGYTVSNVPFVVMDGKYDVILGSNVMRSCRWANFWKNDEFYIEVGKGKDPIPTYFNKPASTISSVNDKNQWYAATEAVSIAEVTIMPYKETFIPLGIPQTLDASPSMFYGCDLYVAPLPGFEKSNNTKNLEISGSHQKNKEGFEITPLVTKITRRHNKINALVKNTTSEPMIIAKDSPLVTVDTRIPTSNTWDLEDYTTSRLIFENIPRINKMNCHCYSPVKTENSTLVYLEVADENGSTATCQYPLPQKDGKYIKYEPGIHILPSITLLNPTRTSTKILLVPDDEGFGFLTLTDIERAEKELGETLPNKDPLFYFLDPCTEISFDTRTLITNLFQTFPFSFIPVRYNHHHPLCVRPALRNIPSTLFLDIDKTTIHFKEGMGLPADDEALTDHKSEIFRTPFLAAGSSQITAWMLLFKRDRNLFCHFYMETLRKEDNDDEPLSAKYDYWIHSLFSELRFMRIPTHIEIKLDGCDKTGVRFPIEPFLVRLEIILTNLSLFHHPNEKHSWAGIGSGPLYNLDGIETPCCLCAYCNKTTPESKENEMILCSGDINDLIKRSKHKCYLDPQRKTHLRSIKNIFPKIGRKWRKFLKPEKAVIYEFTGLPADMDQDVPLDIMDLCDPNDMQSFLNEHPGLEVPDEEKEETENLPPLLKTNPDLYKGFSLDGIPDQFRPGDWRESDIMDRIKGIKDSTKEAFGKLLDKHTNLLSFYPTDGRPIIIDGKPVEIDIKLSTDKPIFLKPYPVVGKMVEVLDAKLDELISRQEIRPVESKYNMPILLTHHNSQNKHVDIADKKFRLVIDNRVINSVMEDKNLYSFLVKGVDHLFTRLQGAEWISTLDCVRAYRSLTASHFTQMATAFRTPSSLKYPHVTWAFRSTPDGLANLPGEYSRCIQLALSPKSKACTAAHIDDILVFSPTEERHLEDLDSVFTDLLKCNFLISMKKFEPFQKEVQFLGHIINGKEIWIPEQRKSYFDLLEPPNTKKGLQSLLGICNYMSTFVESYAMKVGPLYDLLKGKTEKGTFTMDEVQMKSFLEIKRSIREAEKLHLLDTSKPIFMECDASMVGIGSVIYHEKTDDKGQIRRDIVRFGSKRHSLTEALHHTSLEREAMAILVSVKQHMHYLASCTECVIKTDLKSLINILSCYNSPESARMARLSHRLYSLPFKWSLVHTPGVDLPIADGLSRIYQPYTNAFADRHLRYPDLKRENIIIPPEWKREGMILSTMDILKAMHQQILFVEKSTMNVKEKRLKSLLSELVIQFEDLRDQEEALNMKNDIITRLEDFKNAKKKTAKIFALNTVSERILITPEFLSEKQNANEKLNRIITILRTTPKEKVPKIIIQRYRLLNDSILVTRKDRKLSFTAPGNLRIVCDADMTIYILSLMHVMSCHYGQNTLYHLFANTYKCVEANTQGFVKIVCNGCRACKFHRPINKKNIPIGRVPLPSAPNDTWMIDHMVFERGQTYQNRRISAAFNVMDLFSNMLFSYLVKDQTHKSVIKCLSDLFAKHGVPRKIVSDNAKALNRNAEVLHFLKKSGVQVVTTTTPYHSKANKVERLHKLLRETLVLCKETFKKKSQFEDYDNVIMMINSRPLSLSLHPHVKEVLDGTETTQVVTPFSLHSGNTPLQHELIAMEDKVQPEMRGVYRTKWQNIIKHYNDSLQKELDERITLFKETPFEIGDLVLIVNSTGTKEQTKFFKNIYQIVKIAKAKFYCAPLFSSNQVLEVHGDKLKPYVYTELFDILPPEVRELMGEGLSPERIKQLAEQDRNNVPIDFRDWRFWRLPKPMALQKRIAPSSINSKPTLTNEQDETISSLDTEESESSSIFSIPDKFPDYVSEATTIMNSKHPKPPGSVVTQLRTTLKGLKPFKPLLKPKIAPKPRSIYDQAVPLESIEKAKENQPVLKAPKVRTILDMTIKEFLQRLPKAEKDTKTKMLENILAQRKQTTPLPKDIKYPILSTPIAGREQKAILAKPLKENIPIDKDRIDLIVEQSPLTKITPGNDDVKSVDKAIEKSVDSNRDIHVEPSAEERLDQHSIVVPNSINTSAETIDVASPSLNTPGREVDTNATVSTPRDTSDEVVQAVVSKPEPALDLVVKDVAKGKKANRVEPEPEVQHDSIVSSPGIAKRRPKRVIRRPVRFRNPEFISFYTTVANLSNTGSQQLASVNPS